ncbi:MAG: PAS domain-containing protein [Candidatus Eisenbacteria bacterium]|uniref:histidine kinase n=1 Tax=Eiseniibacteriota bacterium TaxID=2212470 RepID=A0A538U3X8_UNCEI|nr:MAG: PAS domain-containing protein [Candidatus Eisenbacteria bacterium]
MRGAARVCYIKSLGRSLGHEGGRLSTRSDNVHRPIEGSAPEPEEDLDHALPAHVLDALEEGVVALDRERKVVYANRWIEDLLGMKPEALVGMPGSRIFTGADARWLRGAARERRDFKFEAEGREMTLKAESLPLRGDDGELIGSVILAEAISETEDGEFQKKIDRLVSLGELSAYVAHEIRNPLTGIRTTVQFVGSKFKPTDPRREDLHDVITELDRIEQIITGLLMFARPPAARPQACDLHQVMDKTLDMIELQLGDASVKLFKDYTEDLPLVYADPDLTQQVFLNLCLNATQAMPEGGELRVATGVRRYRTRRSMVDVSVSDSGVGIQKEAMDKIFDPFFTTRSTGTGLGLPISVQIVREVGGVITAKNNPTGGATFRVSFPVPAEPPGKPEE